MSQFAIGGALGLAGSLASAFGGNTPGRNARQTRDMFYQTGERPNNESLTALYGQDSDLAHARQMHVPGWRQMQDLDAVLARLAPGRTRADFERFTSQNPGYRDAQSGLNDAMSQRQSANLGYFDQQAGGIESLLARNTATLGQSYGNQRRSLSSMFDRSTQQAADTYGRYGRDMERNIREDLDLANRSAEARQLAASSRRGGTNTNDQMLLAGQQSQNRYTANRNIADVRQRGVEMVGGALERGNGQRNSALSNLSGAQLSMEQDRARAGESFANSRLATRLGLENSYMSSDYAARSNFNNSMLNQNLDIANAQRMQPIQRSNQPTGLQSFGDNLASVGGLLLGDAFGGRRQPTRARDESAFFDE